MKGRDSGMPSEGEWEAFFNPERVVEALRCVDAGCERVAEFGCGYGTFTLPVARRTSGVVHAFDIETDLVNLVRRKARAAGLRNVRGHVRDFLATGTGLKPQTMDHAMVFNLLHVEEPHSLLQEAFRILRPGGRLSILHWRSDILTPRGPALEIRPRPEQCREWAEAAGLVWLADADLSACCQYHFGLLMQRPEVEPTGRDGPG